MKRLAGRYAIVQFVPYPETGEFANIGIVFVCPKTSFFDFRLQTRKYARYTRFFRDLEKNVYLNAVGAFKLELVRINKIIEKNPTEYNVREAFKALLHPRDAIIKFSGERGCLLNGSPAKTMDFLYKHYVEHEFVAYNCFEQKLENRVKELVDGLGLNNPFRKETLGTDDFTVNFPLVQKVENDPIKVIKPFYLGQAETNKIHEHADTWIAKLKRLRERNQLPEKILFTVVGPDEDGVDGCTLRMKAFEESYKNLQKFAEVTRDVDRNKIIDFATRH